MAAVVVAAVGGGEGFADAPVFGCGGALVDFWRWIRLAGGGHGPPASC